MGATIVVAIIATGKLTDHALRNLFKYKSSKPVFIYVIINVINKLIPKPIKNINSGQQQKHRRYRDIFQIFLKKTDTKTY